MGLGGEGWGSHTSEHPGSTPGLCTYRKNPKYGHCLGTPHTEAACTYDPRVYRRSPSPRVQTDPISACTNEPLSSLKGYHLKIIFGTCLIGFEHGNLELLASQCFWKPDGQRLNNN